MRISSCAVILLLAVAAQAGEGGTLAVEVRAEEGGPLARVEVVVWDGEGTWTATTDAQGRARIEGLPVGEVNVSARGEGRTAAEVHGVVLEASAETTVELVLGPGIPFAGIVRGPNDEPVADAYVEVEAGGTFEGYGEVFPGHAPYARTWTDQAGRFFVAGIPPGRVGTVVVQADGYEEARVGVRAVGDVVRPSPLVIRMVRGGEVSGLVTAPDGKPVAGAVVYVVPEGDQGLRENPRIQGFSTDGVVRAAWTARSDDQGRYRVVGLPIGGTYVAASDARPFARSAWSKPFAPTAQAYAGTRNLALRKPGAIRLKVVAPEGRTARSVRVQCGGHLSGLDPEEESPGIWVVERLWPGAHTLTIDAQGFLESKRVVRLPEGETVEVEIELDPGVVISGVVVDELGAPVAEVRVEAERTEGDEEGWHSLTAARATTDDEGRFVLGGLRPGKHEIKAFARGFDLKETVEVTAPVKDLRLEGVHLGRLRLRLLTPGGEPLDASVFVWRYRRVDGRYGGGSGSGTDPDDGMLVFDGFRGWERMTLDVEGYVRVRREVEVIAGAHVDLGDIVLEVGLTLEGRVVDAEGRPVAEAVVSHDSYTEATTDAHGRFALPHLTRGAVEIEVDADGFLGFAKELIVAADPDEREDVVVTLSRGTWLHGIARTPQSEPLSDYWFRVERQDAQGVWHQDDYFSTDAEGAFEIRVKTGRFRITYVEERGGEPVILAVLDGKEGEAERLELVLALVR